MKRVRDSAFNHSPLSPIERLSRRRRYFAEGARYPHVLTRRECWIVRAEADGALVGYAWGYETGSRPSWVYIDDVAVHADYQSRGVGAAIIDELVAWLHESGIRYIAGLATDDRMARIFRRHGITAAPPPGDDDA